MQSHLEAEILAASQPLRVPGAGEQRVLSPVAVERLARVEALPRWKVEASALEIDVAPLHYLRNLARYGAEGQIRLLKASVGMVGRGPVLERAAELLALAGIGRIAVLVPTTQAADPDAADRAGERVARAAQNRNASSDVQARGVSLKSGNPAQALQGMDVAAACLEHAAEEQLLQVACRMAGAPLVLAGAEGARGQATTVFPGDPGVALVYKPVHLHLPPIRAGAEVENRAALMVGAWIAEQVTRVVLESGELLRGWLLYADLSTGEMTEYPL
jgi:molybdopterin-synthase adenylyltransferase